MTVRTHCLHWEFCLLVSESNNLFVRIKVNILISALLPEENEWVGSRMCWVYTQMITI